MRNMTWLAVAGSAALVVGLVGPVWAANQTGHGTNGNNGGGVGGGGVGNQGNGGPHGNAGGPHGGGPGGGAGGGGEHGGGGGNDGGHGGGSHPTVTAPSISTSGPSSGPGGTRLDVPGYKGNGKARVQTITDAMACSAGGTKGTLTQYDTKYDGSFTYWSADIFSALDFGQCMQDKGYKLGGATRGQQTNFGTR